ncbi:diaminopimelate decarboxylase [Allocoleopsis franciscana]|nr:diaminopimelate decarboxylase [Allocoleopsis franciscana]
MLSTDTAGAENSGVQYLPSPSNWDTPRSPNQELLPLSATVNSRDCLEIGGCDVMTLVERFGSPLYILDEVTVRTACRQYRDGFARYYKGDSQVLYASKAWNCLAVCAIAASEGLGIDVVSGGELYTALQAGVKANKLYLHGNNKSIAELELAIESGCTIVVDNWLELHTLADWKLPTSDLSGESDEQPTHSTSNPIRIMLRLTPGIECHTHEYIRTGHLDSKFGFDPNALDQLFAFVSQHPNLNCIGLHAHIGSQIFERQPHQDLAGVLADFMSKASGYGLAIQELNVGGGLGIRYTESDDPPSIDDWVKSVSEALMSACEQQQLPLPKLLSEPGRSLIGSACITAYRVGSRKEIPDIRTYIAVDGGMSDNPRPITYQSLYRAVVANRMSAPATETVTLAGKHCESGDILIKEAILPKTEVGDILVVMGTGAYNYSMASNYNRLPRPAAVLVNEGEANLILKRETYQDIIRQDCLPERLMPTSH